jgi:hypothetical protein
MTSISSSLLLTQSLFLTCQLSTIPRSSILTASTSLRANSNLFEKILILSRSCTMHISSMTPSSSVPGSQASLANSNLFVPLICVSSLSNKFPRFNSPILFVWNQFLSQMIQQEEEMEQEQSRGHHLTLHIYSIVAHDQGWSGGCRILNSS